MRQEQNAARVNDREQDRANFFDLWLSKTTHDLELRVFDKERIFTRDPKKIEQFCKSHRSDNVFYGVGSRNGGGDTEHVREIPLIHADLDYKDYTEGESEARQRLSLFEPQPSIIIQSGGGLQVFWTLKDAVEPSEKIKSILIGIADALHSCHGVCDVAHVMRMPGSYNHKYNPPPEVVIESFTDDEYTLEDFVQYEASASLLSKAKGKLTPEEINKKCAFLKHCHQNKGLPEYFWYSMISNLSRLVGGPSLCHEYSRGYPKYSSKEVNEKILHALNDAGPHTCQHIKESGFDCGKDCGVKSPIVKIQRQERTEANRGNSDQSSLHEKIKKLSRLSPYDIIKDILKEISGKEELERNLLISALVEKTKITRKQLQAEVQRFREEELELNDNTVIIHPAYDVHESSINLGFKITHVMDDTPTDQNIYLLYLNDEWQLHTSRVIEFNGRKGVFDLRDRELLALNDKWGVNELKEFVKNPSSPIGVYNSIRDTLINFVEFAHPAVYGLTAAWVIGTYFHRLFNAFPFLFIYGLKRTGKSRFEDVLEQLCISAYKTRSVSVASLADTLDGTRGTFILDQAEILSQKQYVDLLGILADSYTVGGGRRRIVVISNSGTRRVVEFETYGPKVFASTKDIDADLKDRCIEIVMARAEKEYPYPERTLPLWGYLRDQLYRLLLTKWKEAREIYPQAGQDMAQRVRELWRPLDTILILENVDDDERNEIKEYFLRSMEETQAEVSDLQRQLVMAIWSLLDGKKAKDITATEIRDKLALPETEKFTKAKQAQWVGSIIRKLDLYDKKLKRENNRRPYLFSQQKVADIAHRFGISVEDDSQEEFLHEEDEVVQGELL